MTYDTKHNNPCLEKAADDEPIFVIRAQDSSAAGILLLWLTANPQVSNEKRESVYATIRAMRAWPKKKAAD